MNSGYEGFEASWHDLFWEAEKAPSELPLMEKFDRWFQQLLMSTTK